VIVNPVYDEDEQVERLTAEALVDLVARPAAGRAG
jgi:hypothetical protein